MTWLYCITSIGIHGTFPVPYFISHDYTFSNFLLNFANFWSLCLELCKANAQDSMNAGSSFSVPSSSSSSSAASDHFHCRWMPPRLLFLPVSIIILYYFFSALISSINKRDKCLFFVSIAFLSNAWQLVGLPLLLSLMRYKNSFMN